MISGSKPDIITSSSLHKLNITLSNRVLLFSIKSSTVFIAILLASSFGNLNTPVEIQGKEIVLILAENDRLSQGELASATNTTPPSISNIMLRFDEFKYCLIKSSSEGKYRYYSITDLCKRYLYERNRINIDIEKSKNEQRDIAQLVKQMKMSMDAFRSECDEEWEIEFDDGINDRINCKKIEKNKKERLIDQFIVSTERLIL